MSTVKEIVKKYLEENGYGGLWNGGELEEPCGCFLDDLIPCGEPCDECQPGYERECKEEGEFFGCPCIYPDKGEPCQKQ